MRTNWYTLVMNPSELLARSFHVSFVVVCTTFWFLCSFRVICQGTVPVSLLTIYRRIILSQFPSPKSHNVFVEDCTCSCYRKHCRLEGDTFSSIFSPLCTQTKYRLAFGVDPSHGSPHVCPHPRSWVSPWCRQRRHRIRTNCWLCNFISHEDRKSCFHR